MRMLSPRALIAFTLALAAPAMAQIDHSMHAMPMAKPATVAANADMGDGLVKKVDKTKGTVTLAHGALPNGMPPMTMAYKVKDTAWLDQLKAGQKIRFATDPKDGGMTVLRYESVK
ncbi:copper-binding protein [Rhodoferax sp.]|uniref:copper-binding protein n=1 Tax=Rhodoferax sp. TaxID=50421 RepID=UPI00261E5A5B|nr:copper-binding protein [Rhodoferax sp.]MDD2918574.1 copper-binding protein [Rhodoferax sp.]